MADILTIDQLRALFDWLNPLFCELAKFFSTMMAL